MKIYHKNPPDSHILDLEVWYFILADELFGKTLWNFKSYAVVDNNLCGKLVSPLELPVTFDERFKATSVPFFVLDFNLLVAS